MALFALTAVTQVVAAGLSAGLEPAYDTILFGVSAIAQALAGSLIASRYPRNPIGWLFLAGAVSGAISELAQGYGLRAAEAGWPLGPEMEWAELWSWLPGAFAWILIFLLFPDGRLLGPRWRWAAWVGGIGVLLAMPGWSLHPDRGREFVAGVNPMAVEGPIPDVLVYAGMTLFLLGWTASCAALVVRFRRSAGVERQQMKWFAFAVAVVGVVMPAVVLLWERTDVAPLVAAVALAGLPAAACAAILRHRLYDIDVVINRTVVYGVVTLALAGAWAATALLVGTALGGDSALATAIATLVAAAAFGPVRARVQDGVDRRFRRARYDALHRVAAFLDEVRAGRRARVRRGGAARRARGPRARAPLPAARGRRPGRRARRARA